MASKDHYVSQFHLRQFLDADSMSTPDPWFWQGLVNDGKVRRRAPKNIGKSPGMFDGPGCLSDRHASLESFLANNVEGPAAIALREVCRQPPGRINEVPQALSRYLAWAAARSLPMQTLENSWAKGLDPYTEEVVEPPPEGLMTAKQTIRDVYMLHPRLGKRLFPACSDFRLAASEGWSPDMTDRTNFLESGHIQAYYFQVRFFPRFKWFALHAPKNQYFVISDRPVGWVADGIIDAPPSCLRHPSAYILAPISGTLCLVGRHTTDPWVVTAPEVNTVISIWAHDWIAGPTEETVRSALAARHSVLGSTMSVQ